MCSRQINLTEEEKETLKAEGLPIPPTLPLTKVCVWKGGGVYVCMCVHVEDWDVYGCVLVHVGVYMCVCACVHGGVCAWVCTVACICVGVLVCVWIDPCRMFCILDTLMYVCILFVLD